MNGKNSLSKFRLNKIEQSEYKYLLYIEGNVAAHRLLVDMLLGSVILYVDTEYKLWFEHLLEENVHYVKVKRDLSDLIQKILWCREHDEACKEIAKNARELAVSLLTKEVFINTFANYLMSF
jgi:c-di-AMP phosphodiesterase-like protein